MLILRSMKSHSKLHVRNTNKIIMNHTIQPLHTHACM